MRCILRSVDRPYKKKSSQVAHMLERICWIARIYGHLCHRSKGDQE